MKPPIIRGQEAILDERQLGGRRYLFYRLEEVDLDYWDDDERMPYWADIWPSGIALASILAEAGSLPGVRMLELGCGLGLPSIVAARLGAEVVASDYIVEALDLLAINAEANGVEIERLELDWRDPPPIGDFDLVVATDVLYEQWQPRAVAEMLGRTVALDGHAIVVDPDRLPAGKFVNEATFLGFRVVRRACVGEGATERAPISVYDLTWRR